MDGSGRGDKKRWQRNQWLDVWMVLESLKMMSSRLLWSPISTSFSCDVHLTSQFLMYFDVSLQAIYIYIYIPCSIVELVLSYPALSGKRRLKIIISKLFSHLMGFIMEQILILFIFICVNWYWNLIIFSGYFILFYCVLQNKYNLKNYRTWCVYIWGDEEVPSREKNI